MNNFIILNGIDSRTIPGLIISTLPPITKPQMRSSVETIDGRDGDLITKLGFSAYDKEIEIGLSYNYDVDQVISYFNSEGQAVFSNELDKYYNYTILEQIDFEKLLRFKKAKVKFHVQPFKYSNIEKAINFDNSDYAVNTIKVRNYGNYFSKPIITLSGSGIINLSLNNYQMFSIDFGDMANTITLDIENMNAYNPNTQELMNRQVQGNYDNFQLRVGLNNITWGGDLSNIQVSNYSRWL